MTDDSVDANTIRQLHSQSTSLTVNQYQISVVSGFKDIKFRYIHTLVMHILYCFYVNTYKTTYIKLYVLVKSAEMGNYYYNLDSIINIVFVANPLNTRDWDS